MKIGIISILLGIDPQGSYLVLHYISIYIQVLFLW